MPYSISELFDILVHQLRIITKDLWDQVAENAQSSDEILDTLSKSTRFRTARNDIPFVTRPLRQAIASGTHSQMVLSISGAEWIKVELLGRGGQGEAWLVCPRSPDATAEQLIVFKIPKDDNRPEQIQQLQREADILGRINSRYFPQLLDKDASSGSFTMSYIDGKTLEQITRKRRRLGATQTVQIGIDICCALEELHSKDWIHKDIKPDNLIWRSNHVVLLDLGLATERLKQSRRVGTLYYIAPEIYFNQHPPDERADIFSLAATLFRLLIGSPPHFQHCLEFRNRSQTRAHVDELGFRFADPSIDCDPRSFRPEIPSALSNLIINGLQPDRSRRTQSVAAFKSQLQVVSQKLARVRDVEEEMWKLVQVLTELLRAVNSDVDYPMKTQQNAKAIENGLQSAATGFQNLTKLHQKPNTWSDIESAFQIVPRTSRLLQRINGLSSQLHSLRIEPKVSDPMSQDLIARTIETLRIVIVEGNQIAHSWRASMQQLGLCDERHSFLTDHEVPLHFATRSTSDE